MTTSRDTQPTVWVMHHGMGGTTCRFCDHPIRLYNQVGWVDTTAAYYGGSYDMCAQASSGQHEPT